MNAAQFHLLFCHLPIVALAITVLVNLYSVLKTSRELEILSLWLYVVLGVFALVAYFTGEGAEKIMETYPGITEDVVEPHENMGLLFFIGSMVVSVIALVGLYLSKTKEQLLKKFTLQLLIAGILLGILAGITGSTGGTIRHTEIRQGIYVKDK